MESDRDGNGKKQRQTEEETERWRQTEAETDKERQAGVEVDASLKWAEKEGNRKKKRLRNRD